MGSVAIVGVAGIPARYGGFETLADQLVRRLEGHQVSVFCEWKYRKLKLEGPPNCRRIYLPIKANGLSSVIYDFVCMCIAVLQRTQLIMIFGVSGAIFIPFFKLVSPRTVIICNVDGVEWKREKWGRAASWYLKSAEKVAVNFCDEVIADNEAISEYILRNYARSPRLIAYGGDHAISEVPKVSKLHTEPREDDFFLALCRIEPENNVHLILRAFKGRKENLIFIGNWDASNYGRGLREQFHGENIRCIDSVYDLGVLHSYRASCRAYIHGHSAGGTNPVLVEAAFFGRPIIAFDCQYNRATLEGQGDYFASVADLVGHVSALDGEHVTHSALLELATRRYTWEQVALSYSSLLEQHCAQ